MEESFAHLLRRFRAHAGLTLSELAEALGADRKSIRAWEQAKRVPRDRARLEDLAQVLNLSPAEAAQLAAAARGQPLAVAAGLPPEVAEPAEAATPPQALAPMLLHQLRAPIADFVGRSYQRTQLVTTLQAMAGKSVAAVAAIRGMGGIGKTELAYCVAHNLRSDFLDAQIVLDLRGASSDPLRPTQALQQVIHAFRPDATLPEDLDRLQTHYRSLLYGRRVLILADDAHDAAQVHPLLAPPGCALLLTSRQRFSLPGMTTIDLEQLPLDEARTILHQLCPELSAAESAALAHACGYLPLALRISGSILQNDPALPVTDYLAHLTDEGRRLSALRDPDDPQLDVASTLALSYDLLDKLVQAVFRQLGVLIADFSTTLAQAVVASDMEGDVSEVLRILLRRNLLHYDRRHARWQLHDLVRDLARQRLEAVGEAETTYWRYAWAAMRMAAQIQEQYLAGGESALLALAQFDTERAHIDAAYRWAQRHVGTPEGDQLLLNAALAIRYIQELRYDRWHEIIPLWKGVRMAARRLGNRAEEARALGYLGNTYSDLGELHTAISYYEQHLAIAHERGDRRGKGITLGNLGLAYVNLGEPSKAISYYEQALAITRELGDRRREGRTLIYLGNAYSDLGDTRRAIETCTAALTTIRAIGDRQTEGYALSYLSRALALRGDGTQATSTFMQAHTCFQEVGDCWGEAECNWLFGLALAQQDAREQAFPLLRAALAYEQSIGHTKAEEHAALLTRLEAGKNRHPRCTSQRNNTC